MAAPHRPTGHDRRETIHIALAGLAHGRDVEDIAAQLRTVAPAQQHVPGELLLDLAADAPDVAGASRDAPLAIDGIRERTCPRQLPIRMPQHHKSKFALRAAAMIPGGVDPGLLDEVQWWRTDDLWSWSLDALAVYVRAAADRTVQPVASVARRIGVSAINAGGSCDRAWRWIEGSRSE